MLLKNRQCQLLNQKLPNVQKSICMGYLSKSVEEQKKDSMLGILQKLFSVDSDLMYKYASESYKLFVTNNMCTADIWTKRYFEFAVYGMALSNLYLGYDIEKATMKLYTSSFSILSDMAGKGQLIQNKEPLAIDMQKFKSVLSVGKKLGDSISDGGKLQAVRLDPVISGSNVKFKGQIPRSQLDLNKTYLIPVTCMNTCMALLSEYLLNNLLEIGQGDKVRVVTKNVDILKQVYGIERATELNRFVPNPYIGHFYLPSVGASRYTLGVTNIKLEEVDYIKRVPLGTVDLSDVDTNLSLARSYYISCVKKMKIAELRKLASILGIDSEGATAVTLRAKCVAVRYMDRQYYELMKNNTDLFNIEDFKSQRNKFGALTDNVQVPNTLVGLEELLKTGIFKIVLTSKKGGMSTMIVTSNPSEVRRIYGVNYIGRYESEGVRLRAVRGVLSRYPREVVSVKDCTKLESLYRIGLDVTKEHTKTDLLNDIAERLENVSNRTTYIGNTETLTVRSCNATISEDGFSKDFYKQVNLESIVSLTRLSRVQ